MFLQELIKFHLVYQGERIDLAMEWLCPRSELNSMIPLMAGRHVIKLCFLKNRDKVSVVVLENWVDCRLVNGGNMLRVRLEH